MIAVGISFTSRATSTFSLFARGRGSRRASIELRQIILWNNVIIDDLERTDDSVDHS